MKILHVLSSNIFSGAENVACQIIEMFNSYDDIEMFYSSPLGPIKDALVERGVRYIPISKLCKKELKRVIKVIKPDIIHAHDRAASYLSAKVSKNIPVIVHMHVNNNSGLKSFFKNCLWITKNKRYKHVFWVSQSSFDCFPFHKKLVKKSTILYNVIDYDFILNKCKQDKNNYDYDAVYCGRLTYQKNPIRLLKICKSVVTNNSRVKIAIIGNGEFSEYVEKYIKNNSLDGSIFYLGYSKNPFKIIKCSKVLIMTSRFEGTPMVAIEAQLLGVPIVSTPVDGMKDIITPGYNGFLEDEDADLVKRITDMITNNKLQMKMSSNSLHSARRFCDIELYKKVLLDKYKTFKN